MDSMLNPSVSGAISGESCEDFALRVAYGDRRVFRLLSGNESSDVGGAETEALPADLLVRQDAIRNPSVYGAEVDVKQSGDLFAREQSGGRCRHLSCHVQ